MLLYSHIYIYTYSSCCLGLTVPSFSQGCLHEGQLGAMWCLPPEIYHFGMAFTTHVYGDGF